MGRNRIHLGLVACALTVAAVPAFAGGPSKADLEKALSACPPGQSQGQDGLCAPAQGDQMGFDFVPQGDTTTAATAPAHAAPQTGAVAAPHHSHRVVRAEPVGDVGVGFANLKMTFPNASWEMTADDKTSADMLAEVMQEASNADKIVEIGGHTSSTGSAEFNDVLSKKRAEAVREYLIAKGISAERMKAVGYGASAPIDPNDPTSGENRRVVVTMLGVKKS